MMKSNGLFGASLTIGLLLGSASAAAQLAPDAPLPKSVRPLGSRIDRQSDVKAVAEADRRRIQARVFSCAVRGHRSESMSILDHSDLVSADLPAAGLSNDMDKVVGLYGCLQYETASVGTVMSVPFGVLHRAYAEAAYLADNPVAPEWLSQPYSVAAHSFSASAADRPLAEGFAVLSDCMVAAAPLDADALLRTKVATPEEGVAAAKLARPIGGCMFQGQKITATPENIRGWAAAGLWHAEQHRLTDQASHLQDAN